jgi:hypothetical protein
MNTKAKGRRNDQRTIRYLAQFGFLRLMVSAASKGEFDTMSYNANAVIFVQNKTNKLPDREELIQLMNTKTPNCSLRFLFVWHDHARHPEAYLLGDGEAKGLTQEELKKVLLKASLGREPNEEGN